MLRLPGIGTANALANAGTRESDEKGTDIGETHGKRDANKVARQQGRPTNHRVKPGWKITGPPGKRRIVPDEEERATMRTIVEWYDAGLT